MGDTTQRSGSELNEAQQRVLDELGATAEHRPTFADGLAVGLRERLETGLRRLRWIGQDDAIRTRIAAWKKRSAA